MGGVLASDDALVAAMAAGDRGALAELYDRYAPLLLAVATRILADRREAEDLLQDVMLEIWRVAQTYDPTRATVRSWLLLRLRSRAIDRKRAVGSARESPVDPQRLVEWPDHTQREEGVDLARVRTALSALPSEQRAVLELGYFEGLSSSEIASRMSVPIGTVKSRVASAISKLRVGLQGEP